MIRKKLEENNAIISVNVLHAKKKKHILLIFQKIIQILKGKLLFQ